MWSNVRPVIPLKKVEIEEEDCMVPPTLVVRFTFRCCTDIEITLFGEGKESGEGEFAEVGYYIQMRNQIHTDI